MIGLAGRGLTQWIYALSRLVSKCEAKIAKIAKIRERIYSLYQTRRVSRAEPNKKTNKKKENKDHKDEFQKLQHQLTLSTQFDTDHSDIPQ